MKSRLYLPKLDHEPQTVLDFLIAHFSHIGAEVWRERVLSGQVSTLDGAAITADFPYRHGITILYSREVPNEPSATAEETVLYQDADILVADKPHGMVVTPAGDEIDRSLLIRLQKRTGLTTIAPMHRLDRETAGLVLFTIRTEARGLYHQLFSDRTVEREYLAVAHLHNNSVESEWLVSNKLEEGAPWYRRRIAVEGGDKPNAITRIERIESRNGMGLFRLRPETGKKHQLRVHMASIGFPISGDLLYPDVRSPRDSDPSLQLLAYRLSFTDPLSGKHRLFTSALKLLWPEK